MYNFICEKIQEILDSHDVIRLDVDGKKIKNLLDLSSTYDTHSKCQLIIMLLSRKTVKFSFKDVKVDITNDVGYPWNINLNKILSAYYKHNINDTDIQRFFELLKYTLPQILNKINKCVPTEKWKNLLFKEINLVKTTLNNNLKNNSIIKYDFFKDTYTIHVTFIFSKNLNKDLQNKIIQIISEKIHLNSAHRHYHFIDYGLTISYLINSYEALNIDPTAQYLPELGKNKK